MGRRLTFLLAADDEIELGLTVALASLTHAHAQTGCDVIVLHAGLEAHIRRRVSEVIEPSSRLKWLRVDAVGVADAQLPPHLPRAALFRLLAPDLLDAPRMIYLDADVIVRKRLDELGRVRLRRRAVGAVRSAWMPWAGAPACLPWRELGVPPDAPYFNSGVLVIDLPRWRRARVGERALDLLRARTFDYADQDALNIALLHNWAELGPRWNLQYAHTLPDSLAWIATRPAILEEALADPAVVHFNGPTKPWHVGCPHPLRDLWLHWLDKTPRRGWRPG